MCVTPVSFFEKRKEIQENKLRKTYGKTVEGKRRVSVAHQIDPGLLKLSNRFVKMAGLLCWALLGGHCQLIFYGVD